VPIDSESDEKRSGLGIAAAPHRVSDARIKYVRETVLLDMCRFILKGKPPSPSFTSEMIHKFLQRKDFRLWLRRSCCLEIFNRMYVGDLHISALYEKLDEFLVRTTRQVVQHFSRAADIRPIIYKGTAIVNEYAPHPLGSSADLDLVIPHPFFRRACELLQAQNWIQGSYRKNLGIVPYDPTSVRKFEVGHYETVPFSKIFEMNLADAELACIRRFPNGTFFNVVEAESRAIKFCFDIDMHWGYLSKLSSEPFRLKESVFPFAATLGDTDHLYLMLLRNYREAIRRTGKLKNLIVSILLLENGCIDCDWIYDRAVKDKMQTAIAANIPLLERISPHLVSIMDPRCQFARHIPDEAELELIRSSLIGLAAGPETSKVE
jgi:Uncharacterised nucleotidyltransferase